MFRDQKQGYVSRGRVVVGEAGDVANCRISRVLM